jgi:hypothetical protein
MKVWTAEQVRTFLAEVKSDRLYPAWLLMATTGMRRGEILGLQSSRPSALARGDAANGVAEAVLTDNTGHAVELDEGSPASLPALLTVVA